MRFIVTIGAIFSILAAADTQAQTIEFKQTIVRAPHHKYVTTMNCPGQHPDFCRGQIYTAPALDAKFAQYDAQLTSTLAAQQQILTAVNEPAADTVLALKNEINQLHQEIALMRQQLDQLREAVAERID